MASASMAAMKPPTSATPESLLASASLRIDRVDAEWLLLHVLQQSHGWLFAHRNDPLDPAVASAFETLVRRRMIGEPVAYLTGTRGFWSLALEVDPAVLIPRPETELLVELALERLSAHEPLRVADLGTGSGAIALAIAHERPLARVVGVDASVAALELAGRNARRLGLSNVEFRTGDWCEPLHGEHYDLVASNPPYIASGDPHLSRGDLRFEPAMALASGVDGLDAIRRIVRDAPAHLAPRGWLLLEHGWEQGAAVRALMQEAGLCDIATHQDLERRDRVTLGRSRS
jgi:release factor glutamine methyltransferase